MQVDYLIVGTGLSGSTIARVLKDAGKSVLVIDRRTHVGGNVHDYSHPSGIRVHTYGPHYFRTSSEKIWNFVNRFAQFYKYEAALKTLVDGKFESWPVSKTYLHSICGEGWQPGFTGTPSNFEEASLASMPDLIYDKFVKGYTEKQWGVRATALSAGLAKRFTLHEGDDPRLMPHKYQGIPVDGYAAFTRNILHDIPVLLNVDYLKNKSLFDVSKMIVFTGPIDEYFDYDLGRLAYRGQLRDHQYLSDVDVFQPCGQVNNPDPKNGPHIRTLEWKHMMDPQFSSRIRGTVITQETPFTPESAEQYEYPFPDSINSALYEEYRARANRIPGLLITGRLGEYKYFDMDQVIARALVLVEKILAENEDSASREM